MDSILVIVSVLTLVPCIFFILRFLYSLPSNTNNINPPKLFPPSPPKLPIIGHIHKLGLLPHRSLHSLSQKYGPLFLLYFGTKPVLVVSSEEGAREIMKTQDSIFSNRPKSGVVNTILRGKKDIAFSDYDERWRQMRSICVSRLLSNKIVSSFKEIREGETSEMIESIHNQICSFPFPTRIVNLSEMFVKLTNDVIFRATLGRKYSDAKIVEMILEFAELIGVFNIADYIPWLSWVNHFNGLNAKVDKVARNFHEFIDTVIRDHRDSDTKESDELGQRTRGSNFLDILLQIQKDNNTTLHLEDDDIKAIIIDMFAGGTDTTHTLMDWIMVELLRHPKIMQKLQREVRQVVKEKSQVIEDDLKALSYLKAVIKETLRLHCPIPLLVPHESSQDTKVMGYNISSGTQVIINGWSIGRNFESWLNPEEFQPQRFLSSEIDFEGFHFQFIPFGAGRRGCPGTNFAIVLNQLVLANLVLRFDFALPNGIESENMEMEEKAGINVKRKAPLFVVVSPSSC